MPVTAYSLGGSAGFSTIRTTRSPSSSATPRWRRCSGSARWASRIRPPRSWRLKFSTAGASERLRDPARLVLVGVEEPVDPVVVAVPEQAEELARVRPAGDEHQLGDARLDKGLDRVGHHRPVVDREQVLVRDQGQRVQPRARAAGEDHALERAFHRLGCYDERRAPHKPAYLLSRPTAPDKARL